MQTTPNANRKHIVFYGTTNSGKSSFIAGQDFPQDLEQYDLVIHCGGCMLTRKTMCNRIRKCEEAGVAMTNYGILLAFLSGVLERSYEIVQMSN